MKIAMHNLGDDLTIVEVDAIMRSADSDGDGMISLEELTRMMQRMTDGTFETEADQESFPRSARDSFALPDRSVMMIMKSKTVLPYWKILLSQTGLGRLCLSNTPYTPYLL